MKYFTEIPNVLYSLDDDNLETNLVKNILVRIRLLREVMENSNIYYQYDMKETDNPEIIAHKMYNNPERHWIFMMANDIQDPYYDIPLDRNAFDQYIINKYGSYETAATTLHHYEKRVTVVTNERGFVDTNVYTTELTDLSYDDGELIGSNVPTVNSAPIEIENTTSVDIDGVTINVITTHHAVSAYEYEELLNETKRNVKIPKKETIQSIEKEFSELVSR